MNGLPESRIPAPAVTKDGADEVGAVAGAGDLRKNRPARAKQALALLEIGRFHSIAREVIQAELRRHRGHHHADYRVMALAGSLEFQTISGVLTRVEHLTELARLGARALGGARMCGLADCGAP